VGPITCYIRLLNPNVEYRKLKQIQMTKKQNSKSYDPEDRAFEFARRLREPIGKWCLEHLNLGFVSNFVLRI